MLKSGVNKREIASFHDLIGIHMTFSKSGANKREIARALRRDLSVVKREIKRGSVEQRIVKKYQYSKKDDYGYEVRKVYFADTAQRVHEENRRKCGTRNKVLAYIELVSFVEERILRVGEVAAGRGTRLWLA